MKSLTPKQERFCQELLKGTPQSEAYGLAFDTANMKPKTIHEAASRLAKQPHIVARLEALRTPIIQKIQKTRAEWLEMIERTAFFDIRQLLDHNGNIKPFEQISEDAMPMVAGLEVNELWEGSGDDRKQTGVTKKVKLVDRLTALQLFGKATGYLQDKPKELSPLEEFGAAALMAIRDELKARLAAKGLLTHAR